METPQGLSQSDAWTQLQQRIQVSEQEGEVPVVSLRSNRTWLWASAAAVAVVLVGFMVFSPGTTVQKFAAGQTPQMVRLPDGSTVSLNDHSTLAFDAGNWESNRRVDLTGEAFFEVARGQKFTVYTSEGAVEVLGTSFNVNVQDGQFETHCYTGKVAVTSSAGSTVVIRPGEFTRKKMDEMSDPTSFDVAQNNWRAGSFEFFDTPLQAVLGSLSRQYDVDLSTSNEGLLVSLDVDANTPLTEVLEVIGRTYRLQVIGSADQGYRLE